MKNIDFGFTISKPRTIDIDHNDLAPLNQIIALMPEFQCCIGCGGCTATCSAGAITDFNFRQLHTLVRRGEYATICEQLSACMLCGKCRLVCPRGLNTRAMVLMLRERLAKPFIESKQ